MMVRMAMAAPLVGHSAAEQEVRLFYIVSSQAAVHVSMNDTHSGVSTSAGNVCEIFDLAAFLLHSLLQQVPAYRLVYQSSSLDADAQVTQ